MTTASPKRDSQQASVGDLQATIRSLVNERRQLRDRLFRGQQRHPNYNGNSALCDIPLRRFSS